MFIIIRKVEGKIEILKHSNSPFYKTFSNFSSAKCFANKLNSYTSLDKQWDVQETK